jgi:hypothetical protein
MGSARRPSAGSSATSTIGRLAPWCTARSRPACGTSTPPRGTATRPLSGEQGALRDFDDAFAVSTKVGRLIVERPGADAVIFVDAPHSDTVFDFSRDGALRSLDASLERLGLDRGDIVYLHDPTSSRLRRSRSPTRHSTRYARTAW